METRVCKQCKIEKSLTADFRGRIKKSGKTYYSRTCRQCTIDNDRDRKSEWYFANRDRLVIKKHENYLENIEVRSGYRKQYYEDNKEEIAMRNKKYMELHPDIKKKCSDNYHASHKDEETQYRERNKDKLRKQAAARIRNRRKTDINFKLRTNISRAIHLALKGKKNKKSILKYLPYVIQELKEHLEKQFEPWMTWENWGKYDAKTWNDSDPATWTWQIDHIIPQSDLIYVAMSDENFNKCWTLSNLRPMNAKQNIKDGPRRTRHKKAG
jgi:hypothetical protein